MSRKWIMSSPEVTSKCYNRFSIFPQIGNQNFVSIQIKDFHTVQWIHNFFANWTRSFNSCSQNNMRRQKMKENRRRETFYSPGELETAEAAKRRLGCAWVKLVGKKRRSLRFDDWLGNARIERWLVQVLSWRVLDEREIAMTESEWELRKQREKGGGAGGWFAHATVNPFVGGETNTWQTMNTDD